MDPLYPAPHDRELSRSLPAVILSGAKGPTIRILVITMHADRVMADASLQSGAMASSRKIRTADIAAEIGVTDSTVTFHRQVIRKTLGIDTEWGLLRYAIVVRMSEEEAI